MKSGLIACFAVLLVMPGCNNDSPPYAAKPGTGSAADHAKKHLDSRYVCPMHPKISRQEPGSCPVCGMDLVAKKSKKKITAAVTLTPDVIQKMGIRSVKAKRGTMWKYIKTVGYVAYNERRLATVSTRSAGWIENLGVRTIGMQVKKGQLLLELYSPEFLQVQKEFLAAQKKDLSGTLKKYGQREESVGPRDHLRYLNISESLANEIARTGKKRHRIPIYSPQHGVIIRHNVHKHMYVEPFQDMFTIADLSTVWVEADIYEHQLQWVKRGLTAEIEVQALPGERFTAQLTYIYPELDPETRTLKVRLLVPNPKNILKPNMFAKVMIYGGPRKKVLKVPRQALISTGERESVIIDKGNGRFEVSNVVSGMRSKGEVEILKGLKPGQRVVVSGQFLIDSEASLQASYQRLGNH